MIYIFIKFSIFHKVSRVVERLNNGFVAFENWLEIMGMASPEAATLYADGLSINFQILETEVSKNCKLSLKIVKKVFFLHAELKFEMLMFFSLFYQKLNRLFLNLIIF
jgi:hypothetical protein